MLYLRYIFLVNPEKLLFIIVSSVGRPWWRDTRTVERIGNGCVEKRKHGAPPAQGNQQPYTIDVLSLYFPTSHR